MKKNLIIIATLSILASCNPANPKSEDQIVNVDSTAVVAQEQPIAPVGTVFNVVAAESSLGWLCKKVGGQHSGKVSIKEGTILVGDSGNIVSGNFILDMTTISCDDIKDKEKNGMLVGHLKDADFFDVAKFPTSKFEISKVEKDAEGKTWVVGNLTIKDKTNEIKVPSTSQNVDGKITATAKFNIDRTKWGIVYNSLKSIGDKIKDKAINDEIEFTLSMVAVK